MDWLVFDQVFHFTRLDLLPDILTSNRLASAEKDRVAVSVTRSQNHIYTRPEYRRDVVLVLDRTKLTTRYRLNPDHGDIWRPKTDADRDRWRRQGLFEPGQTWTDEMKAAVLNHGREAEERIYRPVESLHLYLNEIVLRTTPNGHPILNQSVEAYAGQHGIPLTTAPYTYHRAWYRNRRPIGLNP
jgi:hypothetical protein